jgi:hypothetical protein
MPISMHQASAAAFSRGLVNLAHVLRKGAEHAASRKIEDRVFLDARLYPDMLPLTVQVRIVTDFARGTLARLAGQEVPKWEDNETTFADLIARVERTQEVVKSFTAEQLEGSETRETTRAIAGKPRTFTGLAYLLDFALPNFYFHATTTYAILRHNGVELGKRDFLGSLD